MPILSAGQVVNTWSSSLGYRQPIHVDAGSDGIFCSSRLGLFRLDTQLGEIKIFDKTRGLSGSPISALAYRENPGLLLVGHQNGIIDLIVPAKGLSTIHTLERLNLEGSKRINGFLFREGEILVASDLGIVVVDAESKVVVDAYRNIGSDGEEFMVSDIEQHLDSLFVIGASGAFQKASREDNLLDFNFWIRPQGSDIPAFLDLQAHRGKLFALSLNALLRYEEGNWIEHLRLTFEGRGLRTLDDGLYVFGSQEIMKEQEGRLVPPLDYGKFLDIRDVAIHEGQIWVADHGKGLLTFPFPGGPPELVVPNGPYRNDPESISFTGEHLWFFYPSDPADPGLERPQYSRYDGITWKDGRIDGLASVRGVATHRADLIFFSKDGGLYSSNRQRSLEPEYFDEAEVTAARSARTSLWICLFDSTNPLVEWHDGIIMNTIPTTTLASRYPRELKAVSGPVLWIQMRKPADPGLPSSGDGLWSYNVETHEAIRWEEPGDSIFDYCTDRTDKLWVSSEEGIFFLSDATFVDANSEFAEAQFFDEPLLEGHETRAIEFDGANRAWFGTDAGLWLYDEGFTQLIDHYHKKNSPLFSDEVLDLAFNPANGSMHVLTSEGLVSFHSDSSAPATSHEEITVYPNPVPWNYSGDIGFRGFVLEARIHITTTDGRIIARLQSKGGGASWDMVTLQGSMASPGIYFLYSFGPDGEEGYVGKFAIVR